MWSQMGTGLRMNLFLLVLVGLAYPLAITGICQLAFSHEANGSLITSGGRLVGSKLIGQDFREARYLHPRPSAAGPGGYDAMRSGGSNLGPTNRMLIDHVRARIAAFRKENPGYVGPVPADIVTSSASGLDPHISPASALAQAPRVAKARGVPVGRVNALIADYTEQPVIGLLGDPRVNVLLVNLALDRELNTGPGGPAAARPRMAGENSRR